MGCAPAHVYQAAQVPSFVRRRHGRGRRLRWSCGEVRLVLVLLLLLRDGSRT